MAGLLLKNANFTTSFVNLGLVATMGSGLFTGDHILFRQVNSEHFYFSVSKTYHSWLGTYKTNPNSFNISYSGPLPQPQAETIQEKSNDVFQQLKL